MMTWRTSKYLDMGELGEQLIEVHYDYQPEERATRDYPGCNEYIEINSVKWEGLELLPFLSEKSLDNACEEIIEDLHDDEDDGR